MFQINLVDLDREGEREIEGEIPPDSDLWTDALNPPSTAVHVDLTASTTATGQVIVRGSIETSTSHKCRRCLEPVEQPMEMDITLVWTVPDEMSEAEDDPEMRTLDPTSNELDLAPALREEILLAVPRFVLCRDDCQGLCPRCGIDRNHNSCDCSLEEPDPRWDALRALHDD